MKRFKCVYWVFYRTRFVTSFLIGRRYYNIYDI